jgi:DNA polymerase III subunit epsilon
MRGYRWSMNQNDKQKAWFIELKEDQIEEEINYLRSEIYGGSINIPIEIFDSYSRFSNH